MKEEKAEREDLAQELEKEEILELVEKGLMEEKIPLVRVVKDQAALVQAVMDNLVPMELQVVMVLLDQVVMVLLDQVVMVLLDQEAVVKEVTDRLLSMDHLKK